ncbi:MAG TPA: Clp protease ClpS [Bacteroidales bacterium]|nr:MAG: hypothetical protein A2X11_09910 [Bacteroidetes bacterium GWE2_42_24]OFY26189.1 MAG: hypothetical protein A2X09_05230 [Bacteroidetes bacterium GWF2_43_11]HBZ67534.1 Clp protease ClpS [Bacteroidales bacterium]
MGKTLEKIVRKEDSELSDQNQLILYNDDVNTFEYVIDCLMEVVGHVQEQAEQCALTAHVKGRCPVKSGSFTELKVLFDELSHRQLSLTIE